MIEFSSLRSHDQPFSNGRSNCKYAV